MAIKIFDQPYIDSLDINNIPEDFLRYFNGLMDSRKEEIILSRPELADALQYGDGSVGINSSSVDIDDETTSELKICKNIYDGINIFEELKNDYQPLEILCVPDGTKKCKIHRLPYETKNVSFHYGRGTYGVNFMICKECNRLYLEETNLVGYGRHLTEKNINYSYYDLAETAAFIRSQLKAIEFEEEDVLYIPETWTEDNPTCPIHNESLELIDAVKRYKDRTVEFKSYCCDSCNKYYIRLSDSVILQEKCAMAGVPLVNTEEVVVKKPKKKSITPTIRLDYILQNGRCEQYDLNQKIDCYQLGIDDTVVVSDSTYCSIDDHSTEEVLTIIKEQQKREGIRHYVCMLGYCSSCEKYYMEDIDYKYLYSKGRPELTIINETEDEYSITSGEIFEKEKVHLNDVEKTIDDEIDNIMSQDDYVSQSETLHGGGTSDEFNQLKFEKQLSASLYEGRLSDLSRYKDKPYSHRVDLKHTDGSVIYYIGDDDVSLNDGTEIISVRSNIGRTLVHYRTMDYVYNGQKCPIVLQRNFDIQSGVLYSYENQRTDEDIVFRSGVTDPFLVRALNMRKKKHDLVDIYVTIQENQNTIVDAPFSKSLIVQGCAGSGKTMVLLHRLSTVKYDHPEFDFRDAMILTPNNQFSTHIKGLADGLQIGGIERLSIEKYYIDVLSSYSRDLKPNNKITSEIPVNQKFVDYIYSDDFIEKFNNGYSTIIDNLSSYIGEVKLLFNDMGIVWRNESIASDSEFLQFLDKKIKELEYEIKRQQDAYKKAKEKVDDCENRIAFINKQLPLTIESQNKSLKNGIEEARASIGAQSVSLQRQIDEEQQVLFSIEKEIEELKSRFFVFGRNDKLDELRKKASNSRRKITMNTNTLAEYEKVFSVSVEDMPDEEKISWLDQVALLIPDVKSHVRFYNRFNNEIKNYNSELDLKLDEFENQKENLRLLETQMYPDEQINRVNVLKSEIDSKNVLDLFSLTFEIATKTILEECNIKMPQGTKRYTLYAQVLFAMKYYNYIPKSYRFICVDEGQQIAINEFRLINRLNDNQVIFNIYGDINQLLKPGRGIHDWSILVNEFDASLYTLNENYRNTNQITKFCNTNFGMTVSRTGVDGPKVKEIPRNELELELNNVVVGNSRVAILVPRSVDRNRYLDNSKLSDSINRSISHNIGNGSISFMYVDEVRGIEFDKVFVISNKMSRNEKYIAYTRALTELIVVVDNEIDDVTETTINVDVDEDVE